MHRIIIARDDAMTGCQRSSIPDGTVLTPGICTREVQGVAPSLLEAFAERGRECEHKLEELPLAATCRSSAAPKVGCR
ncbi:MAG: hypothetical protein M3A44_00910 [Gammaproteobacteria bacterium]